VKRREFIGLLGSAAVTWPLVARAQQGERMRRIGFLLSLAENDPEVNARIAAFQHELEVLGWTEGRNIRIDYRFAGGDAVRIDAYVAELLPAHRRGHRRARARAHASARRCRDRARTGVSENPVTDTPLPPT
jgi:hypothetical protein